MFESQILVCGGLLLRSRHDIDTFRLNPKISYSGQSYLIYPAYAPSGSRTDVPTPDKHGISVYEDLTLETPDKLKIRAFLMLQGASQGKEACAVEAKKRPTILFLHANAGNMVRPMSPNVCCSFLKLVC